MLQTIILVQSDIQGILPALQKAGVVNFAPCKPYTIPAKKTRNWERLIFVLGNEVKRLDFWSKERYIVAAKKLIPHPMFHTEQ